MTRDEAIEQVEHQLAGPRMTLATPDPLASAVIAAVLAVLISECGANLKIHAGHPPLGFARHRLLHQIHETGLRLAGEQWNAAHTLKVERAFSEAVLIATPADLEALGAT